MKFTLRALEARHGSRSDRRVDGGRPEGEEAGAGHRSEQGADHDAGPGAIPGAGARTRSPAALSAIDLQVGPGEAVAVIGPSGAGKTTLLEVLALARAPTRGQFLWDDTDPWALHRAARQRLRATLLLAPQIPPLPPRQRVVHAVLAACLPQWSLLHSLRSLAAPAPQDNARVAEALAVLDLGDRVFDRVDRLSGGERQRVALARLLVGDAALWLVDEPLSALDPARAQRTVSALVRSARERGATLVASLHQVDVALAHFPRIVGLKQGRVAFDLPAREVSAPLLDALYAEESLRALEPAAPVRPHHVPDPLPWAGPCR